MRKGSLNESIKTWEKTHTKTPFWKKFTLLLKGTLCSLRGSQLTPHIFSASNFKQLPFQHNAWYDPENLGHKKALTASQAPLRRILKAQPHRRTSVAQAPRVFGTIFSATGHLEVLWFSPWIKNSSLCITIVLLCFQIALENFYKTFLPMFEVFMNFSYFFLIHKIAN